MYVVVLPYPKTLNHMRTVANGRLVTSKAARKWKADARLIAPRVKAFEGPVWAGVTLLPRAKKDGTAHKTRPDLDNICKAALDAMSGIFWVDDRQIECLTVKIGSPCPHGGLVIEATEMNETGG